MRDRYGLDDDDMRALGSRLADAAGARSAQTLEFAKRFTEDHRATFDRLAEQRRHVPPRWQPSLEDYVDIAVVPASGGSGRR